jgi:photosystem II stability/assembly factor-like uncharacterized protein
MQLATGRWRRLTLPQRVSTPDPQMSVIDDQTAVVFTSVSTQPPTPLMITTDGGASWRRQPLPLWHRLPCTVPDQIAAAPPATWWFLCIGGAAAGSSAKALFRTDDAGRSWRITSAVESIISPQRPGQITLAEPDDLAAGSSSRLWLATFNGLTESGDGGDRWSNVARNEVETYGDSTTIDGLSATLAWLLAPGGAMWRTTDGGHWRQLGPQHLL